MGRRNKPFPASTYFSPEKLEAMWATRAQIAKTIAIRAVRKKAKEAEASLLPLAKAAILGGKTFPEAARLVGLTTSVVYGRLREDPEVAALYRARNRARAVQNRVRSHGAQAA